MAKNPQHPRRIIHNFLSLDLCKELEFIHKSCCTIGYRPNVFSTTLSHLIATNCAHLVMPFVPLRERLKETAEEFFGCEFELFVEFTGLISWSRGASIGWHSDDNRPYLKQRDFAYQCTRLTIMAARGRVLCLQPSLLAERFFPGLNLYVITPHPNCNGATYNCAKARLICMPVLMKPYSLDHIKAVCYLNSYDEDFKGGLFHFRDWEPTTIAPMAGDVVMYTADGRNIHSVDEITDGERLTLTLWFTRDGSHDEDAKLISFISQSQLNCSIHKPRSFLPQPASSKMYWFPPDQASTYESGFDICFARIHALGYHLWCPQDESCFSASDSSNDILETLTKPLRLIRGDELFGEEFGNILHVLQAVQFYCWKATEFQMLEHEKKTNVLPLSRSQRDEVNRLRHIFLKDEQLAETLFSSRACDKCNQYFFNWSFFSAAVTSWEAYCTKLGKEMLMNLPYWRTHQSIFSVPSLGIDKGTET